MVGPERKTVKGLLAVALASAVGAALLSGFWGIAAASGLCGQLGPWGPSWIDYLVLVLAGPASVLLWSRGTAIRTWERALAAALSLIVAVPLDYLGLIFAAGANHCFE